MANSIDQNRNLYIEAFLALVTASGIIFTYFFFSINLAYGLAMLLGLWYIDAYLKNSFEYPNESLFADLSFASFIYFIGQKSVGLLLSVPGNTGQSIIVDNQIIPIIIGLYIVWLGNLRLCRALIKPELYTNVNVTTIKILSCVIALFSMIIALLPQIIELGR
jgi:hypothetical protein